MHSALVPLEITLSLPETETRLMPLLDKCKKKREEESDTTLNANIFVKSCAAKFHS